MPTPGPRPCAKPPPRTCTECVFRRSTVRDDTCSVKHVLVGSLRAVAGHTPALGVLAGAFGGRMGLRVQENQVHTARPVGEGGTAVPPLTTAASAPSSLSRRHTSHGVGLPLVGGVGAPPAPRVRTAAPISGPTPVHRRTQMAHRTLEKRSRKHKACLPRSFCDGCQ